jgi:hypothetical protein
MGSGTGAGRVGQKRREEMREEEEERRLGLYYVAPSRLALQPCHATCGGVASLDSASATLAAAPRIG